MSYRTGTSSGQFLAVTVPLTNGPPPTSAWITGWIKRSSSSWLDNEQPLFLTSTNGAAYWGNTIVGTGGYFAVSSSTDSGSTVSNFWSTSSLPTEVWHFVAIGLNGAGQVLLSVDGGAFGYSGINNAAQTFDQFSVGGQKSGGSNGTGGDGLTNIGGVAYWSGNLVQADLNALYNGGANAPDPLTFTSSDTATLSRYFRLASDLTDYTGSGGPLVPQGSGYTPAFDGSDNPPVLNISNTSSGSAPVVVCSSWGFG